MKRLGMIAILVGLMALTFAPVASAQTCANTPANRLQEGDTGQVAQTYSSVRAAIGSPVILATMYSWRGDTFEVVGEPVCAGPHWWIPVEFNGITGYATEGYLNQYWLEPAADGGTGGTDTMIDPVTGVQYYATDTACPGAPMPRITPGEVTFVAQNYSSLRAGIHSNIIYRIITPGVQIDVLDGPFCAFGPYNWYEVSVDGVTGWVTEGTGSAYWLTESVVPGA